MTSNEFIEKHLKTSITEWGFPYRYRCAVSILFLLELLDNPDVDNRIPIILLNYFHKRNRNNFEWELPKEEQRFSSRGRPVKLWLGGDQHLVVIWVEYNEMKLFWNKIYEYKNKTPEILGPDEIGMHFIIRTPKLAYGILEKKVVKFIKANVDLNVIANYDWIIKTLEPLYPKIIVDLFDEGTDLEKMDKLSKSLRILKRTM